MKHQLNDLTNVLRRSVEIAAVLGPYLGKRPGLHQMNVDLVSKGSDLFLMQININCLPFNYAALVKIARMEDNYEFTI